jgi:hypothetical protein
MRISAWSHGALVPDFGGDDDSTHGARGSAGPRGQGMEGIPSIDIAGIVRIGETKVVLPIHFGTQQLRYLSARHGGFLHPCHDVALVWPVIIGGSE